MVLWSELTKMEYFLKTVIRPNFLMILYVVDDREPLKSNDNCAYRFHKGHLRCFHQESPIYPINVLRDLAIDSIQTTHSMCLDMDLIPCGTSFYIVL